MGFFTISLHRRLRAGEKDCDPKWTKESNYLYLWLSGITYAGRVSHDPFFSKWADTLFEYGETKLKDRRDIRSWTSMLGFPQLYLEPR